MAYSWKGYLKFSLVSIPVRSYSAVDSDADEIHFNQLHEKCHNRIRYKKTCPVHGEVTQDEIVLGYEYEKGKYVVVKKEELEALQGEAERSVNVEVVVPLTAVDPIYFTERSSYLVPDGVVGQKPYSVILKALNEAHVAAVGRLVKNGKDSIVMIRPQESLLVMTALSGAEQVMAADSVAPEAPKVTVSAQELKLTKSLLDVFYQKKLDLSEFTEQYTERVKELVAAKVAGKQIARPAAEEGPHIINLMDALKKSVASAKSSPAKKPARPKTSRRVNQPVTRSRKKSG
jgi:DNA end-binding protein Ku